MKFPLSKGEIVKDFIRALLDVAENQIEESIRNTHSTPSPKPLAKTKRHQARTTSTTKESTMTGTTTITTILLSTAIITTTTATLPDKCMPYGVIQPEEKFQLVHTQKEALNISNYVNNMKTISTGAKDLRRQLEKAITTAPKEGEGDTKGRPFPQQYAWQHLGTPRVLQGMPAQAASDCLAYGQFPPTSREGIDALAIILNREAFDHTYLSVDIVPGALISQITGENLLSLASTTIEESKFDQHRVVSFEKPSGTWTITAPPLTKSRNYICIFPTGALKTEGIASRAKGAINALINNIQSYQKYYGRFSDLMNSAPIGKGDPTQSTSTIKQVKSYILPQIMDYIKSFGTKTTWGTITMRDYANIAKLGNLFKNFITRHIIGQKSVQLKYNNQIHNFKPETIKNQIAVGTTFTTDHATWVQIYRFHPFIIGHNRIVIDVSYIISTEGTYYAMQEAPRKTQCHSGPAGGEACISVLSLIHI